MQVRQNRAMNQFFRKKGKTYKRNIRTEEIQEASFEEFLEEARRQQRFIDQQRAELARRSNKVRADSDTLVHAVQLRNRPGRRDHISLSANARSGGRSDTVGSE